MKKTLLIALSAALLICITSCSFLGIVIGSINGTWENDMTSFTFNSDGTGEQTVATVKTEFTWKTSGNKLTTTYSYGMGEEYTYELSGDTLTLKGALGTMALKKK